MMMRSTRFTCSCSSALRGFCRKTSACLCRASAALSFTSEQHLDSSDPSDCAGWVSPQPVPDMKARVLLVLSDMVARHCSMPGTATPSQVNRAHCRYTLRFCSTEGCTLLVLWRYFQISYTLLRFHKRQTNIWATTSLMGTEHLALLTLDCNCNVCFLCST